MNKLNTPNNEKNIRFLTEEECNAMEFGELCLYLEMLNSLKDSESND